MDEIVNAYKFTYQH